MSKYDLAIFDVDGTLLNTTEGIIAAVKHTIEKFKLDMPSDETLTSYIGPPIQDTFRDKFRLSGETLDNAALTFRNWYKEFGLYKAVPYHGIFEALSSLGNNGVEIAVATYKREDYALDLLRHFGFDKYSKIMHGSDMDGKLKKSDIILKCIEESHIAQCRAVMIGDTESDYTGAMSAKTDFLAVTYGFGFKSKGDVDTIGCIGAADAPNEVAEIIIG